MGAGTAVIGIGIAVTAMILAWLLWRAARGGPHASEPSAEQPPEPETGPKPSVARPTGPHPRPAAVEREARRELRLLEEALRRRFFEQSDMTTTEWAAIANELVVVHDRLPATLVREKFEAATDVDAASLQPEPQETPRQLFAELNRRLPAGKRLRMLGGVQEPIDADIWGPGRETNRQQ